jgi:peptide deformylase
MIIKQATQVGNPVIRTKSRKVAKIDSGVKRLIANLVDSMRYQGLVGMAAPQVGTNLRVFVTEIRRTNVRKSISQIDELKVFINPEIVSLSKTKVSGYEGCGSVAYAQLFGKVRRAKKVVVRALDEKGELFEIEASGLLARIIQHEYDHIEGKVFLDRLEDTKSLMSINEYIKKAK